jgi:Calcium/calmodulin dependent protein kinase II Association.
MRMRLLPSCAVVCGGLLLGRPAAAQSRPAAAERQLQPLLEEMLVAANAHDTDRFLKPYVHDSTLVMVFNGMVIVGFDSVRTLQLKWWNNGRSDVVYSRRGPARIAVLSPGAVVVTDPLRSARADSAGVVHTGDFAATSVWQKRPEGWRIVAVHESTVGH